MIVFSPSISLKHGDIISLKDNDDNIIYRRIDAMPDNQRLADMKQYLAMEKADPDGSKLYIADLEASIKNLEKRITSDSKFIIMNTHGV